MSDCFPNLILLNLSISEVRSDNTRGDIFDKPIFPKLKELRLDVAGTVVAQVVKAIPNLVELNLEGDAINSLTDVALVKHIRHITTLILVDGDGEPIVEALTNFALYCTSLETLRFDHTSIPMGEVLTIPRNTKYGLRLKKMQFTNCDFGEFELNPIFKGLIWEILLKHVQILEVASCFMDDTVSGYFSSFASRLCKRK
jgi:hypothetical protein